VATRANQAANPIAKPMYLRFITPPFLCSLRLNKHPLLLKTIIGQRGKKIQELFYKKAPRVPEEDGCILPENMAACS
jgi:hypothetical protein